MFDANRRPSVFMDVRVWSRITCNALRSGVIKTGALNTIPNALILSQWKIAYSLVKNLAFLNSSIEVT